MEWWIWLALGLVLMVIELATPSGFFVMFFGLGALTVGVLTRLGVAGPPWMEWLLFTVFSIAYVLFFRGRLQQRVEQPGRQDIDTLIGELALPRERIPPAGVGRVELRGSIWNARNDSTVPLEPGRRSRVTRVDGLVVFVQPE
jgi:membrane protein implicated in regulation of membrane protease activity